MLSGGRIALPSRIQLVAAPRRLRSNKALAESNRPVKSPHTVVWKECEAGSSLAERFHVPTFAGYLPFFVEGEDVAQAEQGHDLELNEEQLLKGILYGFAEFNAGGKPWCQETSRNTYLWLLDCLGNGFNFESPEQMILEASGRVRERSGCGASSVVLSNGVALIPTSSKIRADLVLDLWQASSEENDDVARKDSLSRIPQLIGELEMADVNASAKEAIAYYGLASLVLLGRSDATEDYLPKYIYPYVSTKALKDKVKTMVEKPETVTQAELTIR